jgi:hypothetical protein
MPADPLEPGIPIAAESRAAPAADSSAGQAGEFRLVVEPEQGPARPSCPSCGAAVADRAVVCVHCGLNLRTGAQRAAAVPQVGELPALSWRDGALRDAPVRTLDILKAPFHGDVPAEAFLLALGWLAWAALVGTGIGGLIAFRASGWMVSIIAASLVILWGGLSGLAWTARKYVAIIEQHESGALIAETERSKWQCLGMFVLVSLIAGAPVAVVTAMLGDAPLYPPRRPLIAAVAWAFLYWPMGIAMAGAYGTLNPAKVLLKILLTFPAYLVVLVYLMVLIPAVSALGFAVRMGIVRLVPTFIGSLAGAVVGSTIAQYGIVCEFAMLGMLLRKYAKRRKQRSP